MSNSIVLPSKPKIIKEEGLTGLFEIDGLYPGYGHTLGNSLRRIVLSSLEGAAITSVKIDGVAHEFSTIENVREDVITILLNLKSVRLKSHSDDPVIIKLEAKGEKSVTAADIEAPSQIEILNPEAPIATLTHKNATLSIEMVVERGLGFIAAEERKADRTEIGTIVLDADFTPIRRVNYEVENMRVGDRTDFNRLRMYIETDGTLTPREALEKSIVIMIEQLRAVVGFEETAEEEPVVETPSTVSEEADDEVMDEATNEFLKTRIEDLELSTRIINALTEAKIRTVGGLARKRVADVLDLPGLGDKGVEEIRVLLATYGIELKD